MIEYTSSALSGVHTTLLRERVASVGATIGPVLDTLRVVVV